MKEETKLLKLWLGNRYYTSGKIVREVKEILASEDLNYDNVELVNFYGMPCEALKELPRNYEIVDFGSRETILICLDNSINSDKDFIEKWDGENWGQ